MPVPDQEINRQYRLVQQTLGIHAALHEHFRRLARCGEVILVSCSVVFCATTFAEKNLYTSLGLSPGGVKIMLGIASVLAFLFSLLLLIVDWRGEAARHWDAVKKWSEALALFRKSRGVDGTWPEGESDSLSSLYWETCRNTVGIPDGKFNKYKSRYLLKVQASKVASKYPGSPIYLIRMLLRLRTLPKVIRHVATDEEP